MERILSSARQALISKAIADFDNKISTANGFVPKYEDRQPFQMALPWNGLVKSTLSADPRQTGIGIVMSIDIIKDAALAFIYTDINGDGVINNCYIVEM